MSESASKNLNRWKVSERKEDLLVLTKFGVAIKSIILREKINFMKRIINMLLWMLAPMCFFLFLLCFTEAFVKNGDFAEPLEGISIILSIVFGAMFVTGFIRSEEHTS